MASGVPTKFNQKMADFICSKIASGKSLREICEAKDMPDRSNVFVWLRKYQDFQDQYTRARSEQAETIFDEMLDIADESIADHYTDSNGFKKVDQEAIQRARLRIDTRKWVLGKMKPKKYGEKIDIDMTADVTTHQYEITTKDDPDDIDFVDS